MKSAYIRYNLTLTHRKALDAYRFAEKQADKAKTKAAYQACKDLGMTHKHGL